MIKLENYGQLDFKQGYPENWSGRILKGSHPLYWSADNLGSISIQQIKTSDFAVSYVELKFLDDVVMVTNKEKGLESLLVLSGQINYTIQGIKYEINRGKFILLGGKEEDVQFSIVKNTPYQWFKFQYGPALYKNWINYFPSLLQEIKNGISTILHFQKRSLPVRLDLFDSLLSQFYSSYPQELQAGYTRIKVEESLYFLLARFYYPTSWKIISRWEAEKADQAYNLIIENIKIHYSNDEIANRLHINETDLKRIFKERFGIGMYALLKLKRLERARELILQGERISTIANKIGYKHTTTFLREFKKKYSYSAFDCQKNEIE